MLDCRIEAAERTGVHVMRPTGDLDLATADDLISLALLTINNQRASELVIDLSGIAFIDSTGLGALVQIRDGARAQDCAVRIAGLSGQAARIFTITKLDQVFEFDDSPHR
jgi:anti-sigma B factor antagonist